MIRFFFILLACFISSHALAIDEKQAVLVTRNFLIETNITHESSRSLFSLKEVVKKEDMNLFYIMRLGDDEGFVIVSASEYLPPVFGYSFENKFEMHPSIQYYLDEYSHYVLSEKKSKHEPRENFIEEWSYFLQENFSPKRSSANGVSPLITSRWNQNKFYNTYCPWDARSPSGFDNRVPNGCVALAGAQLMNYYRHPERGKYTYTYKPYYYPQQTVYASQQTYNWDAMCDKATEFTNEIAKLAYHLGVTVGMGYAPGGSGAQTTEFAKVLNENFNYSVAEMWVTFDSVKLKKEIDAFRPILMDGCASEGCHAFIVDGYSGTPIRFHFNWGWGGESDGYFYLDGNHGNQSQYFPNNGTAFLSIKPISNYPVQCQQYKRQTASQGYITNGSTNLPYQKGPDCSWMIAAPGATQYTFTFSRLETKEDIDVVTIYNGSNKSSGIAAVFSGTQTPAKAITVKADSVLITFTSTQHDSENDTYKGFLMNYTTNKPPQKCNTTTNLTASSGYITDGTLPGENYTPWISCSWNIAPNNNTGFFGLFHEFDLGLGDFVEVYDATTKTPTFITRFDKNTPPTVGEIFSIPKSKIQIKFITDNYDQRKGFKLQYFSILGVNNNSLLDNLTIFPNPASDVINLSFSSQLINQPVRCSIVDVTGKEVCFLNIDYQDDIHFAQISVAHLSKGIYFLQLLTSTGKVTSKIIKI